MANPETTNSFHYDQKPREIPLISLKKPAETNFLFCQALWDLLSDAGKTWNGSVV